MSIFQSKDRSVEDVLATAVAGDAASRTLSETPVENEFVAGVYRDISSWYDLLFGPLLHPGRLRALERMDIQSGDDVLEVGVGTGINACLYPSDCHVTGIDLSRSMLAKAHDRIARKGIENVRLLEMDAANIEFPDGSFDLVYAAYLINVVPDPLAVASEMSRVCRPGGRIVFLNHFLSTGPIMSRVDHLMSPFTVHVGFKSDLDLPAFLAQTQLHPTSIESVNIGKVWQLLTCEKPASS